MNAPGETRPSQANLAELVASVTAGRDLSAAEAEAAFAVVMRGEATPSLTAGLLVALRAKGEAPAEVAGGVRALRRAMVRLPIPDPSGLVDTAGTGGGALTTFNISTAAALVAAGAGVPVAKHGNRSFTSRCGSADVLEELGVRIDMSPEAMARVLERAGIVFMFAPLMHPAMRHVGPIRRELGMFTIMNLLGPLTNPAGVRRQVVGVSDPALLDLVAGGLHQLEHERALVVHGAPGLDELSPLGRTEVREVDPEGVRAYAVEPVDFGWESLDPTELGGGEPRENARTVARVLQGKGTPTQNAAVALNAGAAIYVAGQAPTLGAAVESAMQALLDATGAEALDRLRGASAEA
ncbi:MAG: anthranilate phosphoribosyltransferase [Gemmatimonadota bacterium]